MVESAARQKPLRSAVARASRPLRSQAGNLRHQTIKNFSEDFFTGEGVHQGSQITGAILAGGRGRRLGRDKATLTLEGRPLAGWVAAALQPVVADFWFITNTPEAHAGLGLPLLMDLVPYQGALGGLETALFFARTPFVLAVAVDTPLVSPTLLTSLRAMAPGLSRPALVCETPRGLQPFPGLYAVRLLPKLREFLQTDRRLRVFVEQCRPQIVSPADTARRDPAGLSFLNVNTPSDLEQVRQQVASGRSHISLRSDDGKSAWADPE